MNTTRSEITLRRGRLGAFAALIGLTLLAACTEPGTARAVEDPPMVSDERIGDICSGELGYDVTGPYYASCKNYLRRHRQSTGVAIHPNDPAEHRACEQIGLAKDTTDYRWCVQELYQLDISAAHL